eukprot:2433096-Rhodomonas_salina.1
MLAPAMLRSVGSVVILDTHRMISHFLASRQRLRHPRRSFSASAVVSASVAVSIAASVSVSMYVFLSVDVSGFEA